MMGAFAVLAWIGSLIDNLLLTYLLGAYILLIQIFLCVKQSPFSLEVKSLVSLQN